MQDTVRYLSHPQVNIDPTVPVPDWGLSDLGAARVANIVGCAAFAKTGSIFSSAEAKALQTAQPLARTLDVTVQVDPAMHENDRSATGFLTPDVFETAADAFFAHPHKSYRGWETAVVAQSRIMSAVRAALKDAPPGDVLIVGHGGVGTLLYCACAQVAIDRCHDQGPGGGGNYFSFDRQTMIPHHHWRKMETLRGP